MSQLLPRHFQTHIWSEQRPLHQNNAQLRECRHFKHGTLTRLKHEPAAGGMSHFVQVWVACKLDHGWGSTHEDEGVITGGWQVVSHHVLTDEALTVVPP